MSDIKQGDTKNVPVSQNHLLEGSKTKRKSKEQGKTAPLQGLKYGGDVFAYGLLKMVADTDSVKGSKQGFLGVETELLDPKEYTEKNREQLNVKK